MGDTKQTTSATNKSVFYRPLLVLVLLCVVVVVSWLSARPTDLARILPVNGPEIIRGNDSVTLAEIKRAEDKCEKSPCTHELLRRFYTEHEYFPGDGEWRTENSATRFYPYMCKLQYNRGFNDNFECFRRKGISSIVIMGDSNGIRYFEAMAEFVKRSLGAKCEVESSESVKGGKYTPDAEYFQRNLVIPGTVVVTNTKCGSCHAKTYICKRSQTPLLNIHIQYLGTNSILDGQVQILQNNTVVINTTQEFYLKLFLKNKYPDMFLYFVPFHHTKHRPMEIFAPNLATFRRLMERYLPRRTAIYFIPSHGESESMRTAKIFKFNKFEGYYASQRIRSMTQVFFDGLKDLLIGDKRSFGFFDLWAVGGARDHWYTDGVHMQPIWYDIIIDMFIETLCN